MCSATGKFFQEQHVTFMTEVRPVGTATSCRKVFHPKPIASCDLFELFAGTFCSQMGARPSSPVNDVKVARGKCQQGGFQPLADASSDLHLECLHPLKSHKTSQHVRSKSARCSLHNESIIVNLLSLLIATSCTNVALPQCSRFT